MLASKVLLISLGDLEHSFDNVRASRLILSASFVLRQVNKSRFSGFDASASISDVARHFGVLAR